MHFTEEMNKEIGKVVNGLNGLLMLAKAFNLSFLTNDHINLVENLVSKTGPVIDSLNDQLNDNLNDTEVELFSDEEDELTDTLGVWEELKEDLSKLSSDSSVQDLNDIIDKYDEYLW